MSYRQFRAYRRQREVIAYASGNIMGKHLTVEKLTLPSDSNGDTTVFSGTFVAQMPDDSIRFLPRTKLRSNSIIGDPLIEVEYATPFFPGDVITFPIPFYLLTITGGIVGDTLDFTFRGYTYNFVSAFATPTEIGQQLAQELQADEFLHEKLTFSANDFGNLFVVGSSAVAGEPITLAGTLPNAPIGPTIRDFSNAFNIGTVASVDVENDTLTMTAPLPIPTPAGIAIGVATKKIYGAIVGDFDFTDQNRHNISLLTECSGLRKFKIPYFNPELECEFPNIKFVGGID